jgi:hypothetical protein
MIPATASTESHLSATTGADNVEWSLASTGWSPEREAQPGEEAREDVIDALRELLAARSGLAARCQAANHSRWNTMSSSAESKGARWPR